MLGYLLTNFVSPRMRRALGYVLLDLSVIGMAASLVGVIAKNEPLWVLLLSWFALTLTAWGIILTADVRHEQDE